MSLADIRSICRGEVRENEPLSRHTSLGVGGPADLFLIPADRADVIALMAMLAPMGIPHLTLGAGFNVLVRDGGFRGAVLSLERLKGMHFMPADGCISAEAGTGLIQLVRFAEQQGMSGLEFLNGIPGTVGGAVAVNAGAHGAAILDRVEALTTLTGGRTTIRNRAELEFGYRHLRLEPGEIVLEALFRLEPGSREEIAKRIEACLEHRRTAQKVPFPSAGSFFKNLPGRQAWQLIDQAGLRGATVGGAQVAEQHANFLVNRGGATAADFLQLATMIKNKVKETTGVELEEEVRIVGDDTSPETLTTR